MHISDLTTGEHLESIQQNNNYIQTKPIGFKDLQTCKIFSFGCTERIDKEFVEEKRRFIRDKLDQVDFQFGNYSDDEPHAEVFPAREKSGSH